MKKINMLILTIILALVFLIIEIVIVKSISKYEPETNVIFAVRKIKAGEVITENVLAERNISISSAHSQSIKNINDIIGKRAMTDIEKDEIILASRIAEDEYFEEIIVKDKNSRLFTVEFKGDQANGWQLREGQFVDIIFIPDGKNTMPVIENEAREKEVNTLQKIRNVRIAALIDDKGKLVKNSENSAVPRYISFEVDDKLDQFLAYAKGHGRLEISAIPSGD